MKPRYFSTCLVILKKVSTNSLKSKSKSVSSQEWLARQLSDPYIEKAKQMKLRCRSAFKLMEIDDRFKILKPGHIVVDCGASPGSWTQIIVQRINADNFNKNVPQGKAIAIDKQNIYPIEGARILGNIDFTTDEAHKQLQEILKGEKVHSVLSDMAPNASGIRSIDNENILKLCYSALNFAVRVSRIDGNILVKLWQCGDVNKLVENIGKYYNSVRIVKPKSSRSDSTEIFVLGREFKGIENSA